MTNKKALKYRITKIFTTKFSITDIQEEVLEKLLNSDTELNIKIDISLNVETPKISIDVHSQLSNVAESTTLVEHTGRTLFFLEGLEDYYNKQNDAFELPDNLLIQLHSIAYTHARALLATEISSTIYKDKYFLPVINPSDLIKHLK